MVSLYYTEAIFKGQVGEKCLVPPCGLAEPPFSIAGGLELLYM